MKTGDYVVPLPRVNDGLSVYAEEMHSLIGLVGKVIVADPERRSFEGQIITVQFTFGKKSVRWEYYVCWLRPATAEEKASHVKTNKLFYQLGRIQFPRYTQ